jgi:hypothetical protein
MSSLSAAITRACLLEIFLASRSRQPVAMRSSTFGALT